MCLCFKLPRSRQETQSFAENYTHTHFPSNTTPPSLIHSHFITHSLFSLSLSLSLSYTPLSLCLSSPHLSSPPLPSPPPSICLSSSPPPSPPLSLSLSSLFSLSLLTLSSHSLFFFF